MRKEHGRQRSSSVARWIVDGIGVFINLFGWVLAVWAPVVLLAAVIITLFSSESTVALSAIGIAVVVALLFLGVGVALIWLSRQLMARRVLWVWVGAVLCLLLAVLNVALVAFGAYRTAELIAGGVVWAMVLAVVGVWAIAQRRSDRAPRRARS